MQAKAVLNLTAQVNGWRDLLLLRSAVCATNFFDQEALDNTNMKKKLYYFIGSGKRRNTTDSLKEIPSL